MAKASPGKAKKSKVDPDWIANIVGVLGNTSHDEPARLYYTKEALGDTRDPETLQAVLAATSEGGVARHWLAVIAGASGPAEAKAIAELAATAKSARLILADTMKTVADHVTDEDLLARAAENLAEGVPFAPYVLDRGRQAVASTGRADFARVLDARRAFTEQYAATLADLDTSAQEKKQKAALATLDALTGADRDQMILWIIDHDTAPRDAKKWARAEAVTNLAIPLLQVASALNDGSIYDEEETALGEKIAKAGAPAIERMGQVLAICIDRIWVEAIEHIAPMCPACFAVPVAFEAVMRGLSDGAWNTNRLCEEARHWVRALTAEQAKRVAEKLLEIHPKLLKEHPAAAIGRAMFYFRNPGGLETFAAALDGPLEFETRDRVYDAIYNIADPRVHDVLIAQLWRERQNPRDLVFAYNQVIGGRRHADVMAKLDAEPSLRAAWFYVGTCNNWSNRPKHILDVLDRVIAWGDTVGSDEPERDAMRANIFSKAAIAALEVRRYDVAKRALDLLAGAKQSLCPADKVEETILGEAKYEEPLAALHAGKLEAQQQALAGEVERLRAAGTPKAADDERLGMLAGGNVAVRFASDAKTHEVWFFDGEGTFTYYDGYGIAPLPFTLTAMQLVNGWDDKVAGLAEFASGWRTEERAFQTNGSDCRQVLRAGAKLLVNHSAPSENLLSWRVFGLTFGDAAAARRMFETLRDNPRDGFRNADPFYVPGKKGGTRLYQMGNPPEYLYVCGDAFFANREWRDGVATTLASADAARAAFAERQAALLAEGRFPRQIELKDDIRPATDKPLAQFIDERYRDDNQSAAWHLLALPAIRDAVAQSGLPMDEVEVVLGPPADDADLAVYEAILPSPLPDELRALWQTAKTAYWRIGDATSTLLSPWDITGRRDGLRASFAKRVATIRNARDRECWELEHLDVLVESEGAAELVWDVRQQELDCFMIVKGESVKHHWSASLHWALSESFVSGFVDALKTKFPQIKKLNVGQSVDELGAAKKQPAAKKPAAKKAGAKKAAAKKVAPVKKQPAAAKKKKKKKK